MQHCCDKCKVELASDMTHCPLCGRFSENPSDVPAPTAYAKIDKRKLGKLGVASYFVRILAICAFFSVVVNLFVNLLAPWSILNLKNWWSLYVVSAVIFLDFAVFYPVIRRYFHWREFLVEVLITLAYILFMDYMTDGIIDWSVTYLFPIVLGGTSVAIGFMLAIKKDPANVLSATLLLLIGSAVLFLVGLFFLTSAVRDYTILPAFIALLATSFIFLFFATLKYRTFVKELFKKFHI